MATVVKKEKGLNKHAYRGLTPDQLNELTREQVVELFRARMRRRFTRSTSPFMQKSSINTSDSKLNARNPKRTLCPDRSPPPSRPICEMLSWCPRWLATTSPSIMERASTMSKSNSTWSVVTSVSSPSPTNPPATVRPVSVPPRVPLTPLLNDWTYFDGTIMIVGDTGNELSWFIIIYNHEKVAKVDSLHSTHQMQRPWVQSWS